MQSNLELLNLTNSINNISSSYVFYGGYGSLKEAEEDIIERKRKIDIGTVITVKNDNTYVWVDENKWVTIGGEDRGEEDNTENTTLEKTTCSNCGAPLKISGHKGNVKCEYCGSTYSWR